MNRVIERGTIRNRLSWQMFIMAMVLGATMGCVFFALCSWFFRTIGG